MDSDRTKILIVDDLQEKLMVYQAILDDLGQNLLFAHSGEEALALILQHEFAVILLDVTMPGMNGFETAELIRHRKRSAHTPIIFLTAFADERGITQGYSLGAVDFIQTPIVPEILRAKVGVFVDLYRMGQQVRRQAEERVALAEEKSKRAAAEEANRRSNFLAEVSRAMADSLLDPDTTAQALARLLVPYLGDLVGVTLAGEFSTQWQSVVAWLEPPDPQIKTARIEGPSSPRNALCEGIEHTLTRGEAKQLTDIDLAYPEPATGRMHSATVLPLRARGRILGALTLAFGPSGRRLDPSGYALAEELAGRAGIALDNARLYKDVERADRQKNEFLSMLAHELRNPLAPIRNAAEVLRLSGTEQPQIRWAREVIDRQLTHLVRLVDDLLDLSRITRGKIILKPEPTDLNVVVQHAVEASRPTIEQSHHRLELAVPSGPVWVIGDPARLTQILTNLLNNAAKYTEEGGQITLTLTCEADQKAVIRVRDTGIGIPPEMLGAVFDLFTQVDRSLDRSQGGLGLGLTLVRRLVTKHGGTVEAHSEGPGKGSEFVVRLPLMTEPPVMSDKSIRQPASGVGMRVLLVDDYVDGAESLATLLKLAGHETRIAHDGLEALKIAANFRPQFIFLDIGLPGLTGYEVAERLRADPQLSNVVLVAVTGYGRDEDRERTRAAGFDQHMVKPVVLADILALLTTPRTASGGA